MRINTAQAIKHYAEPRGPGVRWRASHRLSAAMTLDHDNAISDAAATIVVQGVMWWWPR